MLGVTRIRGRWNLCERLQLWITHLTFSQLRLHHFWPFPRDFKSVSPLLWAEPIMLIMGEVSWSPSDPYIRVVCQLPHMLFIPVQIANSADWAYTLNYFLSLLVFMKKNCQFYPHPQEEMLIEKQHKIMFAKGEEQR